jgi:hypothetical protein
MHKLFTCVLLAMVACSTLSWSQDDATVEITESALNRLLQRLGSLSKSGMHQPTSLFQSGPIFTECHAAGTLDCPGLPRDWGSPGNQLGFFFCRKVGGGIAVIPAGPPVLWQWWVTNAHYTLTQGSMTFTATVKTRVGGTENTITRTVPASVVLDSTANRLRIQLNPFNVGVQGPSQGTMVTVTQVDVTRMYTIAVPLEPQAMSIPSPNVSNANLSMRAVSISPQYLADKVRIQVEVEF